MCNLPKFRRNEKQNWELKAESRSSGLNFENICIQHYLSQMRIDRKAAVGFCLPSKEYLTVNKMIKRGRV